MARVKKGVGNVYSLRQAYNPLQRRWFPVIFFLEYGDRESNSLSHVVTDGTDITYSSSPWGYYYKTRPGTGRCDPSDVSDLLSYFNREGFTYYEVKHLYRYVGKEV